MIFLVTGGRGFIGSHFVEMSLQRGHTVVDIDKMTYASHQYLPWDNNENYSLIKEDICNLTHLPSCDVLINFAAESHVDNSINSSRVFLDSNINGVHNILELVRQKPKYDRPLFFQISTDEVYGDILNGKFKETDVLNPSNPYSATKAAAEMLVMSYGRTHDLDYLITRTGNNYGERQYEEKLIPKAISCLQRGKKIPVHGDGSYIRDWIYVRDNIECILMLIEKEKKNDIFNIASENLMSNLDIVGCVLSWFGKTEEELLFVENRKGQDLRYSIDSSKVHKLGWKPNHPTGIYQWDINLDGTHKL